MSERMDWNTFRLKASMQFGESLEKPKEDLEHIRILYFVEDRSGNPVSYIGNTIVKVNNQIPNHGGVVVGDTWMCKVRKRDSMFVCYPLFKADLESIMALDEDQFDAVINSVYDRNRDFFENKIGERLRAEMIPEIRMEIESQYKAELEEKENRIRELEQEVETQRILLERKPPEIPPVEYHDEEEDIPQAPSIPRVHVSPAPGMPEMADRVHVDSSVASNVYTVTRVGRVLISPSFTEPRYFVHVSPNGKYIIVRPHDYGNVICVNQIISIYGLEQLCPYSDNCILDAKYSNRYGGLMIRMDVEVPKELMIDPSTEPDDEDEYIDNEE